jgi:CBS domain-containing protein
VKVRELINSNVPTLSRQTNLAEAGSVLGRTGLSALPVVDRADRVIGLVTEKDVLLELARQDVSPSDLLVEDVLIGRPPVVDENDDVLRCLDLMKRERVGTIPVVDRDDRLLGIVSIGEVASEAGQGSLSTREVADTLGEISRRDVPRGREGSTRSRSRGRLDRIPTSR